MERRSLGDLETTKKEKTLFQGSPNLFRRALNSYPTLQIFVVGKELDDLYGPVLNKLNELSTSCGTVESDPTDCLML